MAEESGMPDFPGCFVCGTKNPRGLHTPFEPTTEGAKANFVPDVTHAGYEDIVHGGIISALLDEAIIWAVYTGTGQFGVTAELTIRFMNPMRVGRSYTIIGRFLQDRGRILKAEASILDASDSVIARAAGKVLRMKQEKNNCSE